MGVTIFSGNVLAQGGLTGNGGVIRTGACLEEVLSTGTLIAPLTQESLGQPLGWGPRRWSLIFQGEPPRRSQIEGLPDQTSSPRGRGVLCEPL